MKHLLLFFLFSGSLDSFSQDTKPVIIERYKIVQVPLDSKPDTLRALILVTLSTTRQGIAHARVGYVVLGGEKVIYLDCRKQQLKLPAKGWGYEVVNEKQK